MHERGSVPQLDKYPQSLHNFECDVKKYLTWEKYVFNIISKIHDL